MGAGGLILAPSQAADCTAAELPLVDIETGATVSAVTVCRTNAIVDHLADVGATAVISSTSDHAEPWTLGHAVYAARNLVERFFGRLREFREAATRHEKRARDYLPWVHFAATRSLIRGLARATVCVQRPV